MAAIVVSFGQTWESGFGRSSKIEAGKRGMVVWVFCGEGKRFEPGVLGHLARMELRHRALLVFRRSGRISGFRSLRCHSRHRTPWFDCVPGHLRLRGYGRSAGK